MGDAICEVCFTSSWVPTPEQAECEYVHPHEGVCAYCGYCRLEAGYHALAAEVETLREVARVLQNTTPEALRQLVTELFTQGRSAWAYLFTDLATSMDALAKRGEEGE